MANLAQRHQKNRNLHRKLPKLVFFIKLPSEILLQFVFSPLLLALILTFPLISHPLSMGLNLLISTVVIAGIIGLCFTNFWMSYTLLLILSGGLLVIFIYVALLASNELFSSNVSYIIATLVLCLRPFLFTLYKRDIEGRAQDSFVYGTSSSELSDWISKFYSSELYQFTIFLVCYLFLTLIVVVYNTKVDNSPLRRQQ